MPAPVITGFVNFLTSQIPNITVWDGEIPRYDTSGNPLNPEAVTIPPIWPAIKLIMVEPGFQRTWTTEDPYDDRGEILIQVYATSRASLDPVMNQIEALLAQASNWSLINLGGPLVNPFYVIQALLIRWWSGQEEGVRTGKSQLLYRGELHYDVMIHGVISTA